MSSNKTICYEARFTLNDAAQLLGIMGWTTEATYRDCRGEAIDPVTCDVKNKLVPMPGHGEPSSYDISGAIHQAATRALVARDAEALLAQYLRDTGIIPVGDKPDEEVIAAYNDGTSRNLQEVVGVLVLASMHDPEEAS
ncbi:MAG: hypothetical protein F4Z28_13355 [Gammaproteobacteria bacterium]|nr:hypothetical protein [Gammaproteobacteria bacterium]